MNYYEILNVSKNATQSEIRASYKKLVKKYHPDIYQGDKKSAEKHIMEINAAYDVLSNPNEKAAYDYELNKSTEENNVYSEPKSNAEKDAEMFNNWYKKYEQSRNNYYSSSNRTNPYTYDNYKRNSSYNSNNNSFYSDVYNRHVKKAENYVYRRLDKLPQWQMLFIVIFFVTFLFLLILVSTITFFKNKNSIHNQEVIIEEEIPEYMQEYYKDTITIERGNSTNSENSNAYNNIEYYYKRYFE